MLDRTTDDETARSGGALREALRRARAEAAQQTDVVVDLRHAEFARLEMLREELQPVFAQVPREIDIFDLGLVPGERPRLFVDMVAFVEMGRDKRSYRFMRDGRHGRAVIAEGERVEPIVEAVTSYVARRLIERERLLADDDRLAGMTSAPAPAAVPAAMSAAMTGALASHPPAAPFAVPEAAAPAEPAARETLARETGGWARARKVLGAFVVGALIGSIAVIVWMIAASNRLLPF